MRVFGLKQLISELEVVRTAGELNVEVTGLCRDSRRVRRGDLFVAIRGGEVDGNRFQERAFAAGAAAVVSEAQPSSDARPFVQVKNARRALAKLAAAFYGHPARDLHLIGVTGTNGKTTTAYLIRGALEAAGCRTGLLGTVAYRVADRLLSPDHTTPDALDLHRYLHEMRAGGQTHVVMEVSSHALAQERTHGLKFQRAVFTNFSPEHLDFHGDLGNYLWTKARLFHALRRGGLGLVNADDPAAGQLLDRVAADIWTFGKRAEALVRGKLLSCGPSGLSTVITWRNVELRVNSALLGEFNLDNLLAAAAVGFSLGLNPAEIKRGLESVRGVPGRMERFQGGQPFEVIVDFAHTPAALEKALRACRRLCKGNLLLVFGCGGERDRGKRPLMGRTAEQHSDHIFVTSDNPRGERPGDIIQEIDAGIGDKRKRTLIEDRGEAIRAALATARPRDLVLISGKGHETTQEIDGRRLPFDDRTVVRDALQELGYALAPV
ncbi:MAG: UDP-N-acetylmuramoyl-L-alanyl-D-glutamate--2,6-diaminopimelate ligase [Calditrichaeota bacterium]|nr:MAG: UDP-N-acetylmuramoyl-L-alanyl-D-glutamate--2,6-diaminopimelate ligase [Calditrichota bacterium]